MDTRTGEIRPLGDDETLPTVEEFQAQVRDEIERKTPPAERRPRPDHVEVDRSYGDMSPAQRLQLLYGPGKGKDRTGSRTREKSDRTRRYERAARREARKRP